MENHHFKGPLIHHWHFDNILNKHLYCVLNPMMIILGQHGSATHRWEATNSKNNSILFALFRSFLYMLCQQGHARDVTKVKSIDWSTEKGWPIMEKPFLMLPTVLTALHEVGKRQFPWEGQRRRARNYKGPIVAHKKSVIFLLLHHL